MIYHCAHCEELFQVDGFGVLCPVCSCLDRARRARYLEEGTDAGGIASTEPGGSEAGRASMETIGSTDVRAPANVEGPAAPSSLVGREG